jgi:threonyl-tRNA synthetase
MRKFIAKNLKFEKQELPIKEAEEKLKKSDEIYKAELVRDLKKTGEQKVTLYKCGDFVDLCQGPHVESTVDLKNIAFKLDRIAGAYWKGDEKNKMLQRIYGLAFENKAELDKYLKNREEAEMRDHRKLGEALGLFTIDEMVGAGLPLWLPKGAILRDLIRNYIKGELLNAGYEMVETPHIARSEVWKVSGHLEFYKENMYSSFKADEQEFLVKPMNCPFHLTIYKNKVRSYRDLPIRYAEFGTVYRYEKSGVLHGLLRVRGFTQDDAHIFCRVDQVEGEIKKTVSFAIKVLKYFGFNSFDIYLSTKPEKAVGDEDKWELATKSLEKALKDENLKYKIDPGEGVFYGPKIDIKVKDVLGRPWQCTTVQVDFNLPERFNLEYINEKGEKERPIMIHRALIGSLERFIGVLIEHYGGAFPVWLAPVQAIVLPISERHNTYAEKIIEDLRTNNIRVEIDNRNESINRKIRDAELQKIPYMLIIGDKEKKLQKVSLRKYGEGDEGQIKIAELVKKINDRTC